MRNRPGLSLLLLAPFALFCVTINVYFPEEEIRDLSERIEDEVERRASEEGESEESRGSLSAWPRPIAVGPHLAVATFALVQPERDEVVAPEISNPAIRRIIDSRAQRVAALNRFKAQGVVGENNQGDVEARDLQQLGLQERAAVQKLVRDENGDRARLYQEIARAKGVESAQLPLIRQTYAETLRAKARSGDWIQMPDDSWRRK